MISLIINIANGHGHCQWSFFISSISVIFNLIMLIQKYDSSVSVHNANDIQTKGAQSLECLARGPIHLAAGPAQQHPDHRPLTMSLSMTMSLTMS